MSATYSRKALTKAILAVTLLGGVTSVIAWVASAEGFGRGGGRPSGGGAMGHSGESGRQTAPPIAASPPPAVSQRVHRPEVWGASAGGSMVTFGATSLREGETKGQTFGELGAGPAPYVQVGAGGPQVHTAGLSGLTDSPSSRSFNQHVNRADDPVLVVSRPDPSVLNRVHASSAAPQTPVAAISAVPEPAALWLWGGGLAWLAVRRYRASNAR